MKTAAVFFADGFEQIEGLSPVDFLKRAGVDVTTVGVKGKSFEDKMIVTSSHQVPIITDTTLDAFLDAMNGEVPDCVVCPGGAVGAENLGACEKLLSFLEKCFKKGVLTCAICASPAVVFGKTNILDGKKWTCYPNMEGCAKSEFVSGYIDDVFVVDENVVTARGPGASEQFSMQIVKMLCGGEVFEKISKGALLR